MSRMAVRSRFGALGAPVILAGVLALSACGGSVEPRALAADATPTTAAVASTAPPATMPATSAPTTAPATSTSTTSTSTTTTTSTLPRQTTTPIDPPLDADAAEPVIEMGRISIPKIGVDMTMYEGIRNTTLDYGPGHWPGSALPGQVGNVVVAGHRTSKHRVFHDVDELEPGDEIIFTADDGTEQVYAVREVEIVQPDAIWIVDPTDTPTVTLFACHPPGSTTQRIVVYGDLVTDAATP